MVCPMDDLPPEREVDCGCPEPLARPVLVDRTGRNIRVTACLRCGEVTIVESLVTELHPHDVVCVANRVWPLSPALHAWVGSWPRRIDWPPHKLTAPFFLAAG